MLPLLPLSFACTSSFVLGLVCGKELKKAQSYGLEVGIVKMNVNKSQMDI